MSFNKKYALRKTAAYGLVSCAVGLMLVGSAPTYAEEGDSVNATSIAEDTQDTSRITDVLNGQVQGVIQASKPLTGNDFIVDADVAPDKLPAIEHYKTIFNQIPASYRRMVTGMQFIHAEDAILGATSPSRAIKIRANYIHPDQKPDFSDGLDTMFHELGHVIDFASVQGEGDNLWSISRDPYMRNLLEKTYPNNVKYVYESFANAFGSWLKYRVLGESESNMQDLYNQFDSLFGDFIFNSPYNNDIVTERTYKESTVFNWTGTFKSDKGEQLHDDAHLSAFYERVIHESNNSKTADKWTLVNRTSDHMEDLHLEDHRFFGYGEPNTYAVGGNVFTVPGRIGDYYLASYDGNKTQYIGQNLWYTWQDNIYNTIGFQGAETNRVSNFVYRQKDTKITLRLIDSEHPEKVYHTVEVPAFTNYEHNGLDTHVFDSFKSQGELLDNVPSEVALENDAKTIDIRLSSIKTTDVILYDVDSDKQLESIQITGVLGSNAQYDVSSNYENLKDKYVIDDASVLSGSYLFKSVNNNPIVIPLKHRMKDTIETKSITRTIFDVDSDDVFNDQIVIFERDKHTDLVTNASTYSDWRLTSESNKWPSYSISKSVIDVHDLQFHESPRFVNAYDDSLIVEGSALPEKVVTPDMVGESWSVYYKDNRQDRKLTIHYVDGEGKTLADDKVLNVKDYDNISFLDVNKDLVPMIDHYVIKKLPDNFEINGQDYEVTITYGKIVGYVTNLNMSTQDSQSYPGNIFGHISTIGLASKFFGSKYDYLTRFIEKENVLVRGDLRRDSIYEPVDGVFIRYVAGTNDLYMKDDVFSLDLNEYNQFLKDNDATYKINALNVDSANYRSDILSRPKSYLGFFDLNHPTLWTKDYVHDSYQVTNFLKQDGTVEYTEYVPNTLTRLLDLDNMKYTKYSINDNNGIMVVPYADFNNITESKLEFPTTVMVYYDEETQDPFIETLEKESMSIVTSRSFDVNKVDKLVDTNIDFSKYEIVTKPNDEGFYKVINFEYFDESAQGTENGEYDYRNKQYVFIAMKHKTQSETESKDVHRTIHVHKPDGSVETITQTVTFTRTKTTDLVTNESTYTDWASEDPNYEEYDVPTLTGYKTSQDKVESSKSSGTDEVVDVTYEPIEQSIHVKIINERGETLKDFEVTGKTDENVKINYPDLSALIPKYDLGELPATWIVQKENNQDIVIIAKDKLTEEPVTKEVTRTINLHQPDGDKQEVQKVTFTGTKVTNEATGEITYKDWSSDDDTFKEYHVPAVEGYTASKESIPSEKVDKDAVDEVIDVNYVGQMQDITIEIVDENNKVLAMKDAHAKTGENIQYDMTKMFESFKDDYMAKDALSGTYSVQAKDNIVLIHVVKRHSSDSETKTITRTIHVTNPDGTQQDVTQTVTFTRSKTTDLMNNQVTYGEWKADNDHFEAYDVPKVNGYTSNIGTVELMPVTPETVSSEVSVSYTENVTETTEEKDFVRYIIVQKPDGSKETITQKVYGSRTKTVHEASGDTSYSDWTLIQGSFDVYTPASIEGYSVREVESVDVDTSSEMPLVEYVVYQAEMKDEGTQTETPSTSDSGTQTENPETVDEGSQTEQPSISDGSTQTDEPSTSDEGTQTENPSTSDQGSQTDKPSKTDSETQTKAEVKVIYQFADGRAYKEFSVNADKGAVIDSSDLEMLPDDMDFDDDFMFYEVKGDGSDEIVRVVKKHVSDEGTQTETPSTNDQGSQTDNPSTSNDGTQTDTPSTSDNGTQTDNPSTKDQGSQTETPETNDEGTQTEKPDVKDDDTDKPVTNDQGTQTDKPSDELDGNNGSTQTKPDNKPVVQNATIKVVYVDENGQTIQSFEVTKQVGSSIGLKDMQDLDNAYVFTDFDNDVKDFVVDKDTTLTLHVKKMQQVDNGIESSDLTPQKDWVKADVKTDEVKKVSVGTNQLPKALAKEAKLPKAGSEDTAKVGMIGATMALLGGMIGFVSRRKVHK